MAEDGRVPINARPWANPRRPLLPFICVAIVEVNLFNGDLYP